MLATDLHRTPHVCSSSVSSVDRIVRGVRNRDRLSSSSSPCPHVNRGGPSLCRPGDIFRWSTHTRSDGAPHRSAESYFPRLHTPVNVANSCKRPMHRPSYTSVGHSSCLVCGRVGKAHVRSTRQTVQDLDHFDLELQIRNYL